MSESSQKSTVERLQDKLEESRAEVKRLKQVLEWRDQNFARVWECFLSNVDHQGLSDFSLSVDDLRELNESTPNVDDVFSDEGFRRKLAQVLLPRFGPTAEDPAELRKVTWRYIDNSSKPISADVVYAFSPEVVFEGVRSLAQAIREPAQHAKAHAVPGFVALMVLRAAPIHYLPAEERLRAAEVVWEVAVAARDFVFPERRGFGHDSPFPVPEKMFMARVLSSCLQLLSSFYRTNSRKGDRNLHEVIDWLFSLEEQSCELGILTEFDASVGGFEERYHAHLESLFLSILDNKTNSGEPDEEAERDRMRAYAYLNSLRSNGLSNLARLAKDSEPHKAMLQQVAAKAKDEKQLFVATIAYAACDELKGPQIEELLCAAEIDDDFMLRIGEIDHRGWVDVARYYKEFAGDNVERQKLVLRALAPLADVPVNDKLTALEAQARHWAFGVVNAIEDKSLDPEVLTLCLQLRLQKISAHDVGRAEAIRTKVGAAMTPTLDVALRQMESAAQEAKWQDLEQRFG